MIVEMTLDQLVRNTEKIETTKRHHIADEVQLKNGYQALKISEQEVVFQAETSTDHNPKIRMEIEQTEQGGIPLTLTTGESVKIQPVNTRQKDVQVTCNCDDFIFRFATVNSKNGVLFGNITKTYIAKGVRKPEGPFEPSVCKHIIKLGSVLKGDGIIH
jgi:hypothetical protein